VTSIGDHLRTMRAEVQPMSEGRIRAWASGMADREAFLQSAILGSIMWDRELGKPEASTLAEGFVVQHLEWHVEIDSDGDVTVVHRGWRPSDAPTLVDGPDDETYHCVSFACILTALGNLVSVSFRPDIQWHSDFPVFGPHRIQPGDQVIPAGAVGPVFLQFNVVTIPTFERHPTGIAP
jgi:hypothetical protein